MIDEPLLADEARAVPGRTSSGLRVQILAIAGFAMMGFGLAALVPTIFRAAGSQPGVPAPVGIAAVSTMGYAGGLIGPPLIGTVAGAITLRGSLAIVLVLLAVLALGARQALAGSPISGSPAGSSTRPGE